MTATRPIATNYATAAPIYRAAGWHGVLPLPPAKKSPPPDGYTGENGAWPTDQQITAWIAEEPDGNVALRLPDGVIGIDVDHYGTKTGAHTLATAEHEHGPLPATWVSSSRPAPSGVRFYRVPAGMKFKTPGAHIDILQRHHRYLCTWPSIHPDTGDRYQWITPDGELATGPPRIDELAELPAAWVTALDAAAPTARPGPVARRDRAEHSAAVDKALASTLSDLYANRHDTAVAGVCALVRLHTQGHPGADDALDSLRTAFMNAVTTDGSRTPPEAEREWDRMINGAHQKVAATPSTRPHWDELTAGDDDLAFLGAAAQPAATQPAEWPAPEPLSKPLGHGPAFPVDILPAWIADQVHAVAASFQVPADLPAMLAIGALSVATMGHVKVKLTGSKWSEHTNLYLVCAMPPGAGKSPVFKSMTRCLVQLQTELMDRQATAIREAETTKELLEQRAKAAFTKAAKIEATRADMETAISLKAQAEEMVVPPKPRLLAEDTTPEALVSLMGEHGGRMALLSSEGGIFDMMAGQYADRGKSANLAVYLQGWSGDTITQDRIGRANISIDQALLSICVTTQPTVIARLGENPELAGRGLPVRFMFAIPPSNVGYRDRYAVLQDVADPVQSTYDAEVKRIGTELARFVHPGELHLTERARDQFLAWDQAMERRQRPGGDLAAMAEWVSKLRATVLRLLGLLHVADGGDLADPITEATVARALVVADYWEAHARIVHETWAASSDPIAAKARLIIEWAIKEGVEGFTARDLQLKHRRQFERIKDVIEPLEFLVGGGWLRAESGLPVEVGRRGQESPRFIVHPDAENLLRACAQPTELSTRCAPSAHVLKGEKEEDLPTSEFSATDTGAPVHSAHGAQLLAPQPVVDSTDPYSQI